MPGIDAVLVMDEVGVWDCQIDDNGDIETTDSLDTALMTSLFTDSRADSSEVPDASMRRGWIGNESTPGIEIGSKLWLYDQSRLTGDAISGARDVAQLSLQWLIEDGIANAVSTSASVNSSGTGIALEVRVERPVGQVENRYYDLWENTGVS